VKESIAETSSSEKSRSFKVILPLLLLGNDEDPDTYDNLRFLLDDPEHLAAAGYTILGLCYDMCNAMYNQCIIH
jgi:hypothetical protein